MRTPLYRLAATFAIFMTSCTPPKTDGVASSEQTNVKALRSAELLAGVLNDKDAMPALTSTSNVVGLELRMDGCEALAADVQAFLDNKPMKRVRSGGDAEDCLPARFVSEQKLAITAASAFAFKVKNATETIEMRVTRVVGDLQLSTQPPSVLPGGALDLKGTSEFAVLRAQLEQDSGKSALAGAIDNSGSASKLTFGVLDPGPATLVVKAAARAIVDGCTASKCYGSWVTIDDAKFTVEVKQ